MKFLTWLITLPIIVFCVLFAVSNRQDVTLDLWPTGYVLKAPLYIVTLGGFLLGFLLGALLFWMSGIYPRLQRRWLERRVQRLKSELKDAQARSTSALPPYGG